MGTVRTKLRDPKTTEFSNDEIVINSQEGSFFFKSSLGLHKMLTTTTTLNLTEELINVALTTLSDSPLCFKEGSNTTPDAVEDGDTVCIGSTEGFFFNTDNTSEIFQITTTQGTVQIGMQNPYTVRFDTSAGKFTFMKRVIINGNGDTAAISSNSGENFTLFTDNFNNGISDGDFLDSANLSLRTSEAVVRVSGDVRAQSNTATADTGGILNGGGNVDAERDVLYGRYVLKADGGPSGLVLRSPNGQYYRITVNNSGVVGAAEIDDPY
jgi:hypothetical protein